MKKKKIERTIIQAPEGAERFTAIIRVDEENNYPLTARFDYNGVTYKVVAVLKHVDGIAIEFLRA